MNARMKISTETFERIRSRRGDIRVSGSISLSSGNLTFIECNEGSTIIIIQRITGNRCVLPPVCLALEFQNDGIAGRVQINDQGDYSGFIQYNDKILIIDLIIIEGNYAKILKVDNHNCTNLLGSRYSRTINVLPGGRETFAQMSQTGAYAFVGMGRGNSQLSVAFAQSYPIGIEYPIYLIDDDLLEEHSLPAHRSYLKGSKKVESIATIIGGYGKKAVPVLKKIQDSAVILKHVMMIFSWPDNVVARAYAGNIASAYAIPLIDIGTSIRNTEEAQIDVRLIMPYSGGCYFTTGGVGNPPVVDDRLGSLLSINLLAVSVALQTYEEYMAGIYTQSVWRQFVVKRDEAITEKQRRFDSDPDCVHCKNVGCGDQLFKKWVRNL